jgi:hypothetical protein
LPRRIGFGEPVARLVRAWLLGVALVFAQHGVYAHALSHFGETSDGHDSHAPAEHPREVCIAYAAASGAAAASCAPPLSVQPVPIGHVAPAPADPLLPSLALTRFASRAPPAAS